MKGNPGTPGARRRVSRRGSSPFEGFDRVGFFVFGGLGHGPEDAGALPEEES